MTMEELEQIIEKCNLPLNHHEALSDARACAELFLIHLSK